MTTIACEKLDQIPEDPPESEHVSGCVDGSFKISVSGRSPWGYNNFVCFLTMLGLSCDETLGLVVANVHPQTPLPHEIIRPLALNCISRWFPTFGIICADVLSFD